MVLGRAVLGTFVGGRADKGQNTTDRFKSIYKQHSRVSSPRASRLDNDYLRPAYMDKSYPEWKGHPPTRATLSEPPFHTFPYKTRRTVYMHKKLKIGSAGRVTWVNIL